MSKTVGINRTRRNPNAIPREIAFKRRCSIIKKTPVEKEVNDNESNNNLLKNVEENKLKSAALLRKPKMKIKISSKTIRNYKRKRNCKAVLRQVIPKERSRKRIGRHILQKNPVEMESAGLLSLPLEMIQHLSSYLSAEEVLTLSETCRQMRAALNQDCVWRKYLPDPRLYPDPERHIRKPSPMEPHISERKYNRYHIDPPCHNWQLYMKEIQEMNERRLIWLCKDRFDYGYTSCYYCPELYDYAYYAPFVQYESHAT